jgi:hypothetical protein
MRRWLFFLNGVVVGVGLLIMLSAGTGGGIPFGIAFCALLAVGTAVAGRWGPGPVAKGVQAPYLARTGVVVVLLCALMAGMLLWRPFLGEGLPTGWFLGCMAMGGVLMVPVGWMGRRPEE